MKDTRPEFDAAYHAVEGTYALRSELLSLYFDQGIVGVRTKLDNLCPGCHIDLIVGYVADTAQDVIDDLYEQPTSST